MNKLKTKVCYYFHHWNEVYNHVNVHKNWNLTCADVKRYEYEQVFWDQLTLCEYSEKWNSLNSFIYSTQRKQSSCFDINQEHICV